MSAPRPMPIAELEVICEDRLAIVQILDEGLNLIKTGLGSVRQRAPSGFYYAQLVTPEGVTTSEIVWLPPGMEVSTIQLASAEPPSALALTLAQGAGFGIEPHRNVRIPVDFVTAAAAAAAPILLTAATAGTVIALAVGGEHDGPLGSPSLFLARIGKPVGDIRAVPDVRYGKPFPQDLFATAPIAPFRARESIAIRPTDPSPTPARIQMQPATIEGLRLIRLAQLVIGLLRTEYSTPRFLDFSGPITLAISILRTIIAAR